MTKEEKIIQKKKELKDIEDQKKNNEGKGNISKFFGVNPTKVDGEEFQKKARNEWQ